MFLVPTLPSMEGLGEFNSFGGNVCKEGTKRTYNCHIIKHIIYAFIIMHSTKTQKNIIQKFSKNIAGKTIQCPKTNFIFA